MVAFAVLGQTSMYGACLMWLRLCFARYQSGPRAGQCCATSAGQLCTAASAHVRCFLVRLGYCCMLSV